MVPAFGEAAGYISTFWEWDLKDGFDTPINAFV